MKERFQQWFSEERGLGLAKDINDEETQKVVAWLFALYFELSSFFHKKHPHLKLNDKLMLIALDSYMSSSIKRKDILNQMRMRYESMLNVSNTIFFNIGHDLKPYKKELIELINSIEMKSKEISREDFDIRMNLNLTIPHDYYLTKKILMKYYIENSTDQITAEMFTKIINESKKYKFYLNLQDSDVMQKLISSLTTEMSNYTNIHNEIVLNKITHAVRVASTSSGTQPAANIQVDFWNINAQWKKKAVKTKYSEVIGGLGESQVYAGPNKIKKGMNYIKDKISKLDNQEKLYDYLAKSVIDNDKIVDVDAANVLLKNIESVFHTLNTSGNANVRSMALLSMIQGYQDLRGKLSLNEPSNKIIELLILQELSTLITQKLIKPDNEKNLELIYRSCVDLMSIMTVLLLEEKDNQKEFMSDNTVIFPKEINNIEMQKNCSNVLVCESGRDALIQALTFSGTPIAKADNTSFPGFRLKTVLSQGKGDAEEKKDIAVYFEVGNKRGKAKEVSEGDDIACVGRISETVFDIDQADINRLNDDVIAWCSNVSDKPKTLCLDMTITKPNDELMQWMQSPDVQQLIQDKKLDILVWQSEQKQHSLGSGKFSAGSAYLLSGDADKVSKFNESVDKANTQAPDNNLSTFFRHYCKNAMHEVVKQQTEAAKFIADQLNHDLEKSYNAKAIANGPFVTIIADKQQTATLESLEALESLETLVNEIWPRSNSFGFSQTTSTSWENSYFRISPGLESKKVLEQEVEAIMARFKTSQYRI